MVSLQADGVFSLTFGLPYVFFASDELFKENWLGIKSGGVTPLQPANIKLSYEISLISPWNHDVT